MFDTIKNAFSSAGSYFVSYMPGAHKQQLMQQLEEYVEKNDAAGIKSLLANKVDLDLIVAEFKESPYSPLHHAAAERKDDALTAMLEKLPFEVWAIRTQNSGRTPFMLAAEHGNAELVSQLYIKVPEAIAYSQYLSSTPGSDAVHALKVAFNCEHAQDFPTIYRSIWQNIVNAKDDENNTPLLLAVQNNHYACSEKLKTMNADPKIKNNRGDSALSLARALPAYSEIRQLFTWS